MFQFINSNDLQIIIDFIVIISLVLIILFVFVCIAIIRLSNYFKNYLDYIKERDEKNSVSNKS